MRCYSYIYIQLYNYMWISLHVRQVCHLWLGLALILRLYKYYRGRTWSLKKIALHDEQIQKHTKTLLRASYLWSPENRRNPQRSPYQAHNTCYSTTYIVGSCHFFMSPHHTPSLVQPIFQDADLLRNGLLFPGSPTEQFHKLPRL